MPSPLFFIIPVAVIGIISVIVTLTTLNDQHSSKDNTWIPPNVEERIYKKSDKKKGQRRRKEKDSGDEREDGDGSVEVDNYVEPNALVDSDGEEDFKSATDLSYDSPAVYSADSKCENLGARRRRPSGCSSTSSVTNQIISPTSTPPSSSPTVSYVTPPTFNHFQSQPATQTPRPTFPANSQPEYPVTTHSPYSESHPNDYQRPNLANNGHQYAGNSFYSRSTSYNSQPHTPSGNNDRQFYNPINTWPQTSNVVIGPNSPYPPEINFNATLQPPHVPNHPPSPLQPPHVPNHPPAPLQPPHMPNQPPSPHRLDPNQFKDLFCMFHEWYINKGHTESVPNPSSSSRRHHKSRSRRDNTSKKSSSLDLGLVNGSSSSSGSSTLSPPLSDAVPDSSSRHRRGSATDCGSSTSKSDGSTTSLSSHRSTKSSRHRRGSGSATDSSSTTSTSDGSTTLLSSHRSTKSSRHRKGSDTDSSSTTSWSNSNGSTTSSSDSSSRSISRHPVAKECCVCLEQASVVPMVILKPCRHRCFCKNCIEQLLVEQCLKCPICRTPIKSYKRVV